MDLRGPTAPMLAGRLARLICGRLHVQCTTATMRPLDGVLSSQWTGCISRPHCRSSLPASRQRRAVNDSCGTGVWWHSGQRAHCTPRRAAGRATSRSNPIGPAPPRTGAEPAVWEAVSRVGGVVDCVARTKAPEGLVAEIGALESMSVFAGRAIVCLLPRGRRVVGVAAGASPPTVSGDVGDCVVG